MLACVVAVAVNHLLGSSLMTTHFGAWYADSALASILTTAALAAWGCYAALPARGAAASVENPAGDNLGQ